MSGISLRIRVFLILAAVITPVMLVFSYLNYRQTKVYVERAATREGQLAAQDLAAWIADHRELEAREADRELERRLVSWTSALEFAAFELKDGSLVPIAARGTGPGLTPTARDQDAVLSAETQVELREGATERELEVSVPFFRDNQVRGVVRTRLSLREADATLATSQRSVLLLTLGTLVFLGSLLYLYLGQAVSTPVLSLITAMRRVTKGERTVLAEVQAGGEMGWLATNFNHMLVGLRRSEEKNNRLIGQIRLMNEELTDRIREATDALAKKNEELKDAQENLFSVQRDLSRVERLASLGQLAGEIAHEVGTPLNAISGHIQLLMRDAALPEAARERLAVVESQVDRLASIIRNVLTTLRPPVPAAEPLRLNDLIGELLRFTAPLLEGKGIAASIETAPDLWPVAGDRSQLQQVFLNFLTNAMDAMPDGGVISIAGQNLPSSNGVADQVELRFRDSGAGIEPGDLKRIFQPFHSTKEPGAGAGLGLAICREIVRRHGGEIRAESEPGRGTNLIVTFPAVRD